MVNIDYIMDLLDWNNGLEKQKEGIRLAKEVKCINVFLQPCDKYYNKNVWDNCAIILSERTDEELSPYLIELMEWLQDMNWPGAFCILERLQKYKKSKSFHFAFNVCLKRAQALDDDIWESNLRMIKNN